MTRLAMWSRRTSTPEILRSGEVLHDQTHRELVYGRLQFHERSQHFIGAHDEPLSVAMRVNDPITRAVLKTGKVAVLNRQHS